MFNKPQTKDPRTAIKSQSSIASFFARSSPGSTKNGFNPPSTPQKLELTRSSSSLSATLRSHNEFDDISSSDTSYDSIEVNNFSNPALARTFNPSAKSNKTFQNKSSTTTATRSKSTEVIYLGDSDEETVKHELSTIATRSDVVYIEDEQGAKRPKPTLKRTSTDPFDQLASLPRKLPRLQSPMPISVENLTKGDTTSLSDEQERVISAVLKDKKSVFFTGSAGTGKSVVLRELVKQLNNKFGPNVGLTASTGMAACNISGQTLHKFLGIGLGKAEAKEMARTIEKNKVNSQRWRTLKVLIIDEISMIDGNLFTKLDAVGQILRGNKKPFGGIQLVCSGDFFQLPPIVERGKTPLFCFETDAWKRAIKQTIVLRTVFRQRGDSELVDMLNALRCGKIDEFTNKKFQQLARTVKYDDGIEPTELYPTRYEVRSANSERLKQLHSRTYTYQATDIVRDERLRKQLDNLMCDQTLELKEGAQVMYLVNYSGEIVNGSMGTIMLFTTKHLWIKILELYGANALSDPEILAEIKVISGRVGRKAGEWSDEELKRFRDVPPSRQGIFNQLLKITNTERMQDIYPVVRFGPEYLFVERHEFSIETKPKAKKDDRDEDKLSRFQVPLILSWAMSIHKAQGQTIERLKINLGRVFEIGQVYVAISRAVKKDSLQILNFQSSKVTVSKSVQDFYTRIGG